MITDEGARWIEERATAMFTGLMKNQKQMTVETERWFPRQLMEEVGCAVAGCTDEGQHDVVIFETEPDGVKLDLLRVPVCPYHGGVILGAPNDWKVTIRMNADTVIEPA